MVLLSDLQVSKLVRRLDVTNQICSICYIYNIINKIKSLLKSIMSSLSLSVC